MSRTPFIAGNWKMNKTIAEAEAFIQGLLPRVSTADGVDVAVCVPFTDLQAVVDSARGSRVEVYAQNMQQAPSGAFTGEVSAPMLAELDVHAIGGRDAREEGLNEGLRLGDGLVHLPVAGDERRARHLGQHLHSGECLALDELE